MLQRIRNSFGIHNDGELKNEVEIDETHVWRKSKNGHEYKKVTNSQGRSTKDKAPVMGMIERGGNLIARQIEKVKSETITPEVVKFIKEANVYNDEWLGFSGVDKIYNHLVVKHSQDQTSTIEGFWSSLKRGILGIYHSLLRSIYRSIWTSM